MKRMLLIFSLTLLLSGTTSGGYSQQLAVKTNLLYGAAAQAPNLGLEVGIGRRSTLDLGAGYNWFGKADSSRKLVHWLAQMEYRYWFCERFSGHFLGIHALGTQYNIAGHNLPLVFGSNSKQHRYEGWGAGAGVSYGYMFYLGRRWSLEANVGVGYVYLDYDQYKCATCGRRVKTGSRNYFGPTKAGISLVYIIK